MYPLQIAHGVNGVASSGTQTIRNSPEFTQTVLLTADTAKNITVPTEGAIDMIAFFNWTQPNDLFYAPSQANAIVVPTGTVTLDIDELLTPGCGRRVKAGQLIQLFTPGTTVYVTISYYAYVQG